MVRVKGYGLRVGARLIVRVKWSGLRVKWSGLRVGAMLRVRAGLRVSVKGQGYGSWLRVGVMG